MDALLPPKDLAAFLGIAEQTVYNRHSTGGSLPSALKLGRLLRFRPSDVEIWLEQQHQPEADIPTSKTPWQTDKGRTDSATSCGRPTTIITVIIIITVMPFQN